jgi:hypothetical protein
MFSPHAGGHRNCNAAPLAIEKKCCALFFLPCFAGTIPKEAAYAVTGGDCECGSMNNFRFFGLRTFFYS